MFFKRKVVVSYQRIVFLFSAIILLNSIAINNAHAIDKRVKLAIKTGTYGILTGATIGGAFWALNVGGAKSLYMGASAGLYAGLLLAGYIIATPPEQEDNNPFYPRRPLRPGDEMPINEMYSPDSSSIMEFHLNTVRSIASAGSVSGRAESFRGGNLVVWTSLVSVEF